MSDISLDRSLPLKEQLKYFKGKYLSVERMVETMGYGSVEELYQAYRPQMSPAHFSNKLKQLSTGDIDEV